uniref:Uncharacterized protein n=1 Tax=Cannabis sativa TaxID=3483 RepID=A0A803PRF9_CANSA
MTPIPCFLTQAILRLGKENPRTETDPLLDKLTGHEGRVIRLWLVMSIEEERISIVKLINGVKKGDGGRRLEMPILHHQVPRRLRGKGDPVHGNAFDDAEGGRLEAIFEIVVGQLWKATKLGKKWLANWKHAHPDPVIEETEFVECFATVILNEGTMGASTLGRGITPICLVRVSRPIGMAQINQGSFYPYFLEVDLHRVDLFFLMFYQGFDEYVAHTEGKGKARSGGPMKPKARDPPLLAKANEAFPAIQTERASTDEGFVFPEQSAMSQKSSKPPSNFNKEGKRANMEVVSILGKEQGSKKEDSRRRKKIEEERLTRKELKEGTSLRIKGTQGTTYVIQHISNL